VLACESTSQAIVQQKAQSDHKPRAELNVCFGLSCQRGLLRLRFQVAALILLLGAQVIAEFERCTLPGGNEPGSGFNT
jgi:hypothetical protein